jgi:hypothetical protein
MLLPRRHAFLTRFDGAGENRELPRHLSAKGGSGQNFQGDIVDVKGFLGIIGFMQDDIQAAFQRFGRLSRGYFFSISIVRVTPCFSVLLLMASGQTCNSASA